MVLITILTGVYKPTYNWGAPLCIYIYIIYIICGYIWITQISATRIHQPKVNKVTAFFHARWQYTTSQQNGRRLPWAPGEI